MNRELMTSGLAAAGLAILAGSAAAGTSVLFDSTGENAPVSVFGAVREATGGFESPAIGVVRDVIQPVFWGRDGKWCEDGQVYNGGPCDNRYQDRPEPPRPPRPGGGWGGEGGVGAALRICEGIFDADDKLACMREVRGARFFDPGALNVCSAIFDAYDKISCLRTIADRWYEAASIRICGGLFQADDKIRCLREQALDRNDPPSVGGPGVDAALRVCEGMFQADDKLRCLAQNRGVRYFSVEAVGVCSALFQADDKIACLGVIANRPYGPSITRICGGLFQADDKIRCLAENGGR